MNAVGTMTTETSRKKDQSDSNYNNNNEARSFNKTAFEDVRKKKRGPVGKENRRNEARASKEKVN